MKVLQLGKFYPIGGGVEKVMLDLTLGLAQQGIQCDMLCANADLSVHSTTIKDIAPNARLICTPAYTKKAATMISPAMISRLRRICNNYDIIHLHHPDPMAALAMLLSGYKGKVVLHWHSDIMKQKFLLRLYHPLQSWIIKRSDIIVGTTPVYIKHSPHLAAVQDKCTFLPIGIKPMVGDSQRIEDIKCEYSGKKIIFSLGRLVHYKGYKYLIDAANYIPDDCIILIGGEGALKDMLQKQIEDGSLQDKVRLLGRISSEDLPNYYEASHLYCLSSKQKTEAFAIVQIEAMSCGKPVIATKIPGSGVSWVNADGESGINVDIEDAKALGDAITKLVKDKELYTRFSTGAKARFMANFQLKKMIDSCIQIYNNVISH